MNAEVLVTNKELCVGCNKCIAVCLVKANIAFRHHGENKVKVDQYKCIRCGRCIEVCDHHARDYTDDTEEFFADLNNGHSLTVIAAPYTHFNFPNYKRFYGYLKSLGVNLVYDQVIGEDISAWAYQKILEEQKLNSIINQRCPVIVNYIEKYSPELIKNLVPIHNPMMCTAVFLKKYQGNKDKIAFLSPCIAKIDEINEKDVQGLVSYNITLKKIEQYLIKNNIYLKNYKESEFDQVGEGQYRRFSKANGLREITKFYNSSAWIRNVEGLQLAESYLKEYSKRVQDGKDLPLFVDVFNCQQGCKIGTGASLSLTIDDIDFNINETEKEELQKCCQSSFNKVIPSIHEMIEDELQLGDFIRRYEDKSPTINCCLTADLQPIFMAMHKTTEESQRINCYACGFGNCREFAMAVLEGTNYISNCIDYNRKELLREKEQLIQSAKEVKELHYLATHDFLTEIPNRYYLEEYLKKLIASETSQNYESALLFIDLDNFKVINDSFGHASGDQILLNFVDVLQTTLGEEAFLARLGGDEFAVVLMDTCLEKASAVANELLQALRIEEFSVEGHNVTIKVTASIGIMMIDGTLDTQTIFSYADVALYTAKDEGKNRIYSIQSGVDTNILAESTRTILQINDALKENRFTLYLQPVFTKEGIILHFEALLRMLNLEGDLVFPNEFLPTAERFGLMSQIDQWVVNSALEILKKHPQLGIFVNISASSLGDRELLKFIEYRIDKSNIQPSRIGFEITETAAIKDIDQAEHWIRRLKQKGCKFALDDFGVGFLTFTHLQRLPVDFLKIDGSFIRNIDVDQTNRALVQAINAVAHALGQATIAEYVENENIWTVLRELKIDYGQGYFLGKPAAFNGKTDFLTVSANSSIGL